MSRLGLTRTALSLVAVITLLLTGQASAGFSPEVVGGSTATPGRFPWLAFIYDYERDGVGLCTGTVISPNVILTAGHCVIDESTGLPLPARAFGVVTGTANWSEARGRSVSGVTRVILNPSFDAATGRDDAALLVLATPTPAPSLPLEPPTDVSSSTAGAAAAFAGWGQTSGSDSMSTSNTLRWARTVIQDPASCQSNISPFDPGTQLCAHNAPRRDTSACFGDSGGPLVANALQGESGAPIEIGIIRSSAGYCDPTGDVVFTAVPAISGWATAIVSAHARDPRVAVAPPPLPFAVALARLPVARAKSYVQHVLSSRFRGRFRARGGYTIRCTERSAYRVRCAVRWDSGPNEFAGTVSVFYEVFRGSAIWADRYAIRWIDAHCSARVHRCRSAQASGANV